MSSVGLVGEESVDLSANKVFAYSHLSLSLTRCLSFSLTLLSLGEGDLAAAHYQHAVRLKPAHYVAMVNLGRLLRSSSENKEAESWYKK